MQTIGGDWENIQYLERMCIICEPIHLDLFAVGKDLFEEANCEITRAMYTAHCVTWRKKCGRC